LKKLIEVLFDNRLGNALDNLLMDMTKQRWLTKMQMKKKNHRGIIMAMDAGKHYAKPDPFNFQYKLISGYQKRVEQILECSEGVAAH